MADVSHIRKIGKFFWGVRHLNIRCQNGPLHYFWVGYFCISEKYRCSHKRKKITGKIRLQLVLDFLGKIQGRKSQFVSLALSGMVSVPDILNSQFNVSGTCHVLCIKFKLHIYCILLPIFIVMIVFLVLLFLKHVLLNFKESHLVNSNSSDRHANCSPHSDIQCFELSMH